MKFLHTLVLFVTNPKAFAQRISPTQDPEISGQLPFLATAVSIVLTMEVILAQVVGLPLQNVIFVFAIYALAVASGLFGCYVLKRRNAQGNAEVLISCYFYILGTFTLAMAATRFVLYSATFVFLINFGIIFKLAIFLWFAWLMLIYIALTNAPRLYSRITVFTAGAVVFSTILATI